MRRSWSRWLAVPSVSLVFALGGCPSEQGGEGGTTTDTGTGSTGGTETTDGTTTDDSVDSTGGESDSTGEPAGTPLEPCDPGVADACDEGLCSGNPASGFYCRPACSSMAEPGTDCGADDVCLPTGIDESLACFDVRECDFLSGEGCPQAGDSCVVVSLDPIRTACVPTGMTPRGDACDPAGMLECGDGGACLGSDLDEGTPGICAGWCEPGAALPPDCPACAAFNDQIGTCAECSVLDDQCAEGSQCQLTNELFGGVCVELGPMGPGEPCSPFEPQMSCQDGLLCIDLDEASGNQPVCIESCDPNAPMCSVEGESCVDVALFVEGATPGQLGVCAQTDVQYCDPMQRPSSCPDDENCLEVGDGLGICGAQCDPADGGTACMDNRVCFPTEGSEISLAPFIEGNGACGLGCTIDDDCGGATCLHLDGLATDGLCGATCTPGGPATCPGGMACVATPEDPDVGACIAGGTACNPSTIGDCGAAACIPLEGETLIGICTISCFSQDPVACGGMPASCISKTADMWHEGTCVGGGEPCDPVANDCAAGQTCGVAAGQAFGGVAYLCDDAGVVPEGGDCSGDGMDCGEGLTCFNDVCRAWCDPMVGGCAAGTCTDVSVALYLPAESLGVCM